MFGRQAEEERSRENPALGLCLGFLIVLARAMGVGVHEHLEVVVSPVLKASGVG